jgi:hypothetical protein
LKSIGAAGKLVTRTSIEFAVFPTELIAKITTYFKDPGSNDFEQRNDPSGA